MNNWIKDNREYEDITDFPVGTVGFVYKIIELKTGKYYIGKKSLISTTSKKLTKKEIAEQKGPGRKSIKKKVIKESDWINYWGSNIGLKKLVKEIGENKFIREILYFCKNKKLMSYYEEKTQFELNVLQDPLSLNDNIQGRFFRKDFEDE
jgi:hypothetical protein